MRKKENCEQRKNKLEEKLEENLESIEPPRLTKLITETLDYVGIGSAYLIGAYFFIHKATSTIPELTSQAYQQASQITNEVYESIQPYLNTLLNS